MAAPPFKVKSVYEYTSEHEDDLNFPIGQVITVTELEGDDWYVGEYTDVSGSKKQGLFPSNFVEKYEPEVPIRPTRPSRQPKQEVQQPAPPPAEPAVDEAEDEGPAPTPANKPAPPPVEIPATSTAEERVRSPPSASGQKTPVAAFEPPPAPKPAPAEPGEPPAPASAKKPPPPVAAKNNAFKDRIAAFNTSSATPLAPMQPGRQGQPSGFIKKPFVAPPPSKNAYVPPPKAEPVHKPYVRDEDPEIKQREEDDRTAAEAAGFGSGAPAAAAQGGEDEDAPKPLTLKERMALLQKEQQETAQRRAEGVHKKKPPQKKPSESEQAPVPETEEPESERVRSDTTERRSLDAPRERARVPSAQRRPTEPMSPVPAPPEHELVSDGHDADQSGAGETSDDDAETVGPDKDDYEEEPAPAPRHPVAPKEEADVGDEEDTTEGDEGEEEEIDEEARRKNELRERMRRLAGPTGTGVAFNPFGAPPPAPARKKQPSKDRQATDEAASTSPQQPQQRIPMVPVPGMQRVQSPESGSVQPTTEKEAMGEDEDEPEQEEAPPPPARSSTMERGAPPPVPKGKSSPSSVFFRQKRVSKLWRSRCTAGVEPRFQTGGDGTAEIAARHRTCSRSRAMCMSDLYFIRTLVYNPCHDPC